MTRKCVHPLVDGDCQSLGDISLQGGLTNKLAMGSGYQSGVQEAVESDMEVLQSLEG